MQRGFLLPKGWKKCSDATQLAASCLPLSTQASALAGMVFAKHASSIAILLGDPSVLLLCEDQDREWARLHRAKQVLDQVYKWTKGLDVAMSQGLLPLDGAPPSATVLKQFPQLMEICFDATAKNSEALWSVRWGAMFDCLCEGIDAFQKESFDGIEIDEKWINYFDRNQDKVRNYCNQLGSAPIWMVLPTSQKK